MTDHDTCQILDQVFGICCPKTKIIRKCEFQKTCQITKWQTSKLYLQTK